MRSRTLPMVTAERLREALHYEPTTGVFTWKVKVSRGVVVGRMAGGLAGGRGYVRIRLDGATYLAHRLAWLYMTGRLVELIDHLNGDKADNRWENLRSANVKINMQNRRRPTIRNQLGVLGVSLHVGRYRASIEVDGRKKYLGRFDTPEEAHAAYVAAKRKLHPGCTL